MNNLCGLVFALWFGSGLVGFVLQLWALGAWTSGSPREPEFKTSLGSILAGPFALLVGIVRARKSAQEVNGWRENRAHWAKRDQEQQATVQEQTRKLQQAISQETSKGRVVLSRQVQGFDNNPTSISTSNGPVKGMDCEHSSIVKGHISVPKTKIADSNGSPFEIEMRAVSVGPAVCTLEPYGDCRAEFIVGDTKIARVSFEIAKGNVQVGKIYYVSFDGWGPRREFLENDVPWVEVQYTKAEFQPFITGYNEDRDPIYTLLYSVKPV